jgi:hypothetical protein
MSPRLRARPAPAASPQDARCRPGPDRLQFAQAFATVLRASLTAFERSPKPASGRLKGLSPFDGALRPDEPLCRRQEPQARRASASDRSLRQGRWDDTLDELPRMQQRSDRGMSQGGWATIIPLLRFVLDGSLGCFLSR